MFVLDDSVKLGPTASCKCQKSVKEVSTSVKSHEIVCYLRLDMHKTTYFLFRSVICLLVFVDLTSCSNDHDTFSETAKVALREAGHQLLLANNDSTSLVQPVVVIDELKYQLSFERPLAIEPDSLVTIIKSSFQKAELPSHYITELVRCEDVAVAYSYLIREQEARGIVPCQGRVLPKACYTVSVRFTKAPAPATANTALVYIPALGFAAILAFVYFRKSQSGPHAKNENYIALGSFKFYPEQNKLHKSETEINLSRKECELLVLFSEKPNEVIQRETLMKKVWEDHGVIVGRSLDTYISKLRKKLQGDETIKLTNVHGVGYKLEIR